MFPSRVRGEQPGHVATTAHLQAAYPFVAEGGLGGRGVYIGRDAYGGSFVYDPWELYGQQAEGFTFTLPLGRGLR